MVTDKYNDPSWVPHSKTFPGYHPVLIKSHALGLPSSDDDEDFILTVTKMRQIYRDAKGKMNQVLANWRKSGNGVGNKKQNENVEMIISSIEYGHKPECGVDVDVVDDD
eukprot:10555336-Ditylum_brightwellii.AAC.1